MKPPIKIPLNATSLKHSKCTREYQLAVARGFSPPDTDGFLRMGRAVHKFAEFKARGISPQNAVTEALSILDPAKDDMAKFSAAIAAARPETWFAPPPPEIEKFVERKFEIPWKVVVIDDQPYHFHLCGTLDRLGVANNLLYVYDFKTARAWDKAKVFAKYSVSTQMIFYYWVLRRFPYDIFPESTLVANYGWYGNVAIRVCPVFLSMRPPSWQMSEPLRYEHLLDAYQAELEANLDRFAAAWNLGTKLAHPDGMLADLCGACDFASACHGANTEAVLAASYEQKEYNPMIW